MVGVFVEHAEHGHIRQEIHGSHIHARNLHAEALFKVGLEFFVAFGLYEVDVVVLDKLAAFAIGGEVILGAPYHEYHDEVDNDAAHEVEITRLGIEHGEGHDEEEVRHLADGHALGAVADNAEDGEESEGCANTHVGRVAQKQVDEHEDADGQQDKSEIVVTTMTLGIVEEMYKYPYDHGVKQEATYHGQQFGGGNKVVNVKELLEHFVHDLRICSIRNLFN